MKSFLFTLLTLSLSTFLYALEGDNLDLKAVLNLFEKSKTIEDFEMQLNSEQSGVNNLDLNQDGYVDFIRVIDYHKDGNHSITLQVPFSNSTAQDVAVLFIENNGKGSNVIQIVGDPDLYGENYIIEPGADDNLDIVNVYNWNIIRFVYSPGYHPYHSPYSYNNYPAGFVAWQTMSASGYMSRNHHSHISSRIVNIHRCDAARTNYLPNRQASSSKGSNTNGVNGVRPIVRTGAPLKKVSTSEPVRQEMEEADDMSPEPTMSEGAPAPPASPAPDKAEGKPTKRPGGTVNPESKQKEEKKKRP